MFSAAWSAEHEALLRGGAPKPLPLGPPVFDRRVFVAAATEAPPAAELPPSVVANTAAAHAKAAALLSGLTARAVARRVAKAARDVALRPSATFTVRVTGAQLARMRAKGAGLSANDVTVGLAWALLRRCRARGPAGAPRLGDGSEHFLLQTVDLRRYLPSLPAAYFGNSAWAMQVTAPAAAEGAPLPLAAGCRASMAAFADSVAIFDQAAAVLRATPAGRDAAGGDAASANQQKRGQTGDALKAALLPAFGDGMFSSWVAPVMWTFTFGAGTPAWFHGGIFPAAPWYAPPDRPLSPCFLPLTRCAGASACWPRGPMRRRPAPAATCCCAERARAPPPPPCAPRRSACCSKWRGRSRRPAPRSQTQRRWRRSRLRRRKATGPVALMGTGGAP